MSTLDPAVRDFIDGGSGDELTLRANRRALDRVSVVPRVLAGTVPDLADELLGAPVTMPVAVAPMAYHKLAHPDGELASARAAKAAGIPFTAATLSSVTVEEIAAVGGTTWFQLYWLRDRKRVVELVRRAEDVGCTVLVLTVDVPVSGRRLRDIRNAFVLPPDVAAVNLAAGTDSVAHRRTGGSALAADIAALFDPELSWADVEWLRARTRLPLVLKGVLDPADGIRALDAGADGLVVSNHGGRQLDGAIASVDALEPMCDAVAGRCPVLFDSGVRGGVDVLRAAALGASGVLLGRPVLWGLAEAGEAGVAQVLSALHEELANALALAGCADVAAARNLRVVRDR